MHKEFRIGYLKHEVETLKIMKQAMTKKKEIFVGRCTDPALVTNYPISF